MRIRLNQPNLAVPTWTSRALDRLYRGSVQIDVWQWDPETGHRRVVSGLTSPLAAMRECWARAQNSRQHHPDRIERSGMAAALLPLPGSDGGLLGVYYYTLRFPHNEIEPSDFIVV